METGASENIAGKRTLFGRAAPGGRLLVGVLGAMVPISAGTLVALDARATGSVDLALVAAAGGFTALAFFVVARSIARLRGLAAVADAVRTAAKPGVTAEEIRLGEAMGPIAADWNQLIASAGGPISLGRVGAMTGDDPDELLNALADGVIEMDRDGSVVRLNAAAAALVGQDGPEVIGRPIDRLLDGALAEPARTLLGGGPMRRQTLQLGTEESPQVLRVRVARRGKSRGGAVLTLTDITRQAMAEASRGSFLARATHELRAPLTNIKLYTEQAIEEGDDPELRQEALNVIGREVLRLERTVGDLLRVSELESGSMRAAQSEIQIDDMLQEIRGTFTAAAEAKSVTLKLDAPPKLPVLRGDRDHIELLVQNLIGNAIKYTPAGGSVVMRADCDERDFTLEVVDTGIGISPNDAALVFEKFHRADDDRVREVEGSGLGLALAREIARRHGGDVTLESELNRGSTFTLRLPISQAMGRAA